MTYLFLFLQSCRIQLCQTTTRAKTDRRIQLAKYKFNDLPRVKVCKQNTRYNTALIETRAYD